MTRLNDPTPLEWDVVTRVKPKITYEKDGPLAHLNQPMTPPQVDAEDVVNRPHHYNKGKIEAIEAIKESMDPEQFRGYLKGNIMKYLWRYEYKNKPIEDLRKARWYLERLIEENL